MHSCNVQAVDHDLGAGPVPIPVTILIGFLGAGKTTLLNRILHGDHGLRVAVLVNDFGSINIDADLVVGVEDNVVSLSNGCVCCSIRDDLIEAANLVIERPERPEYILLEASGVAEPSGIAVTFASPAFRDRIRLDSILCVVDAEQALNAPELFELKLWQIALADMVILNKVDLVDRNQVLRVRAWLDSYLHRYRLVEAIRCDVPPEILLSVGRFDPARSDFCLGGLDPDSHRGSETRHDHHRVQAISRLFCTWSFESRLPLSLETLREVAATLPSTVYRAKGVIYTSDAPDRRAVMQVVGKRIDLALDDAWGDRERRTRIVLIAAAGGIDAQELRGRLDSCVSSTVVDPYNAIQSGKFGETSDISG
jgi:G3E family GTPase